MNLSTFLSLVFQNSSEPLTRVSVSLAESESMYSKVGWGEGGKINKTVSMLVQKKNFGISCVEDHLLAPVKFLV